MMRGLLAAMALLLAALATACDTGATPAGEPPTGGPTPTVNVAPHETDGATSPIAFEQARDALVHRLDAIGVNIGIVPADIEADILASCHELEPFADSGAMEDICAAIERAIDEDDPGLIDLVLDELRGLTPE